MTIKHVAAYVSGLGYGIAIGYWAAPSGHPYLVGAVLLIMFTLGYGLEVRAGR